MTTSRVLITGATGRMGMTLVRRAHRSGQMALVGAIVRRGSSAAGRDAGELAGLGLIDLAISDDLSATIERALPDIVIDFTSAEASVEHARVCATKGVGMVIGSTGFTTLTRAEIAKAAKNVPIVLAPNTSIGVNLVIRMAGELAKALGEAFDIEVLETHHKMKKDAPSGTALRIAEELASATGRTSADFTYARQGQTGERGAQEIGLQTLRGGDVVGEHTVYFFGEGERVELTHRASNRDQFADGALRAARWLSGQAPGLYDMMDVLGLPKRS